MPERNQAAIAEAGRNIQRWKDALFDELTPLAAFAELDVPVLLITGTGSPLSSRAVVQRCGACCRTPSSPSSPGWGTWRP